MTQRTTGQAACRHPALVLKRSCGPARDDGLGGPNIPSIVPQPVVLDGNLNEGFFARWIDVVGPRAQMTHG
jgi:hypothetical protein